MTSPISARRNRSCRDGFTVVELLVVVGIIAVLAGVLIPVVNNARKRAMQAKIMGELQNIATGLEAYRSEFGDYPRGTPAGNNSSQILCRALYGPMPAMGVAGQRDGADGPGFRTQEAVDSNGMRRLSTQANAATDTPQGKIYGPYINFKASRVGDPSSSGNILRYCLLDDDDPATRMPIIYWPTSRNKPDITVANQYVGSTANNPWLNLDDLLQVDQVPFLLRPAESTPWNMTSPVVARARAMLGDYNNDGAIGAGESARVTGGYILWAAGSDRMFGPVSNPTAPKQADVQKCDDVIYGISQ